MKNVHFDHEHGIGTLAGGVLTFVQSAAHGGYLVDGSMLVRSIILASVGATVGYFTTALLKKIFRSKKTKQ